MSTNIPDNLSEPRCYIVKHWTKRNRAIVIGFHPRLPRCTQTTESKSFWLKGKRAWSFKPPVPDDHEDKPVPDDDQTKLVGALFAATNVALNLRSALEGLLNHYVEMINSGDAGNWDPETETSVIAARAALAEYEATMGGEGE